MNSKPHPALEHAHRVLDAHSGRAGRKARPGPAPSRWALPQRLLSYNAGILDKVTLRCMEPVFLSGDRPDMVELRLKLDEARTLYAPSELIEAPAAFFSPPQGSVSIQTKRLRRGLSQGQRLRLSWESTYRTFVPHYQTEYDEYRRNARNYVHVFRHNAPAGRPTAICIHPWCMGFLRFEELLFSARTLYRLGMNVVLFTMPFHGRRTPRQALFPGQLFPSRHIHRTNEAFGQSVHDLRCLIQWIQGELNTDAIGFIGFSLGGYTTALMASLESNLRFAIPIVAPVTFADLMWQHGEGRPQRIRAEAEAGLTLQDLREAFCRSFAALASPQDPPRPDADRVG